MNKALTDLERRTCNIPGYEGLYWVYEDGSVYSVRKDRFLKPAITDWPGYVQYYLTGHNKGTGRWFKAHRLVLYHWIGECPKGLESHHKDHNKANNHYSNLEYVTHSVNILKSFKENGRIGYWKNISKPSPSLETRIKMSNAKIKPCKAVDFNTKKVYNFNSIGEMCDKLGVYRKAVYRAIKNKAGCYKGWVFKFVP